MFVTFNNMIDWRLWVWFRTDGLHTVFSWRRSENIEWNVELSTNDCFQSQNNSKRYTHGAYANLVLTPHMFKREQLNTIPWRYSLYQGRWSFWQEELSTNNEVHAEIRSSREIISVWSAIEKFDKNRAYSGCFPQVNAIIYLDGSNRNEQAYTIRDKTSSFFLVWFDVSCIMLVMVCLNT